MSAQGNPRGSRLILGILLLGLENKIHKKAPMRPLRKNWLMFAWTGSLNPCQGQGLDLGREINLRQRISHCSQETRLKVYCKQVCQDPPCHGGCYRVTRHINLWTTLTE